MRDGCLCGHVFRPLANAVRPYKIENGEHTMLHLYFGNGKGKTSAAIGLGIRACGRGKRVLMVQFLKCQQTGEQLFLQDCEQFVIRRFESQHGFVINPTPDQRELLKSEIAQAFNFAKSEVQAGNCDVLILDEVLDAVELGFLNNAELIALANIGNNKNIELAFTGRKPSDELLEIADYATELKLIKHPYQKGVTAREGIEY